MRIWLGWKRELATAVLIFVGVLVLPDMATWRAAVACICFVAVGVIQFGEVLK